MSSLFDDTFSFMDNYDGKYLYLYNLLIFKFLYCFYIFTGINQDFLLEEDSDWFFPVADLFLDNGLDTNNNNNNNQVQQIQQQENNESFLKNNISNNDESFKDDDYNNNIKKEILTISEDLINKKQKIINKKKDKSSSSTSPPPSSLVKQSTLVSLTSTTISQSQISCTSTISQIAAVAENGSLGFSFPSVEIIPALIGGPWNNCDELNSDDEIDNEDINGDINNDDNNKSNNSASKKKRKRQRPYNPDADLIAAATEENLKLLNIDTNSKEGKVQRRKIRNRMSAQLHRERKKSYINYLENVIRHRESNMIDLQSKINYLTKESEILRNQLSEKIIEKPTVLRPFFDYITSGNSSQDNGSTSNDDTDREKDVSMTSSGTSIVSGSDGSNDIITNEIEQNASLVKSFGKSFPLFSIVLMMGFTLFNSPSSTSSSFDLQPSLNQLQLTSSLQDNSLISNDEKVWKYLDEPSNTNDNTDKTNHNGRVLLSISSLPSTMDNVNDLIPYKQPNTQDSEYNPPIINEKLFLPSSQPNIPIPSITTSKALWKYQDRVLHLFPELKNNIPSKLRNKKRNLRYRSKDNDNDNFNNDYNDKLLVSSSYPQSFDWISSDKDETNSNDKINNKVTEGDNTVLPTSRVFMSHGKALLDPSLTLGIPSSYITPEVTSSKSLSTWRDSNSYSDSSNSNNNQNQHQQSKQVDPNVLYMLLPANQIRWGTSWSESDGTMKAFLDNLNFPSDNDTFQDAGNSYLNSMFVEIGCSVFKAQLVNNVTVV
jgi:hypothetical protein